jgi:hypothetical protein
MVQRHCSGLRLIVSFADTAQGHHGGIYQAAGWIYSGGTETHAYRVKGVVEHDLTREVGNLRDRIEALERKQRGAG